MNNPLVSVVVITYNSADYVVETLDSIKQQTYPNIEIVISDDASKDDTVSIVEKWKSENASDQLKVTIITADKNTGISANLKRGVDAGSGEWVKLIAGDDYFVPDCIEYYLKQAADTGKSCFFSKMKMDLDGVVSDYEELEEEREQFFNLTTEGQYRYFLINPIFLNTPSMFIKKELFDRLPLINVKYRLLEDQPLFYNLLKNGIDIVYCDYPTVVYRRHSQSITAGISMNFYNNLFEAFKEYREKELSEISRPYTKIINKKFKVVTTFSKSSILYRLFLRQIRGPKNKYESVLLEDTIKQFSKK
jgi:glycosyltransferase involved in cell wall biosynthesis